MYRYAALLFVFVASLSVAGPVKPVVPCNRSVYMFGGETMSGRGVRLAGSADLPARILAFFERTCGDSVSFESVAVGGEELVDRSSNISDTISQNPRSIALIHFPYGDIEAGESVDRLLQIYQTILAACASSESICIIGGQQPVNSFSEEETARQRELERRSSAAFGQNYLQVFRHFESESRSHRLMLPLDSGDGRFINDYGHELLYKLYRGRLLELSSIPRR